MAAGNGPERMTTKCFMSYKMKPVSVCQPTSGGAKWGLRLALHPA